MEDFSRQNIKSRFPCSLKIPSYLQDHFFDGKAVFPAVEALITLARAVKDQDPQASVYFMADAVFPRLLAVAPDRDERPIQIELVRAGNRIDAALTTCFKTKQSAITRRLDHARVTFVQEDGLPGVDTDFRRMDTLEGPCLRIDAAKIYRELVPFGPAYRNIIGELEVFRGGALGTVSGGTPARDAILGSPFALDAAMHAACVWGQRFADTVAFPVGIDKRIIYLPTQAGKMYSAGIFPVAQENRLLVFNACILNRDGVVCEVIKGLRMRDVTRGGMRPPEWIKE